MCDRADFKALCQRHTAEALGVTARSLRDWAECPRSDNGTYNLPEVIAWKIARESGATLDLDEQRARLAKAQADKTEMEISVRGGELLERSRVIREVGAMLGAFQSRVIAIPDAIGQLFEPRTARTVVTEVRRKLYEALAELSQYRPGLPDGAGVYSGATAEPDVERVGGRESKTIKRKQRGAGPVEN